MAISRDIAVAIAARAAHEANRAYCLQLGDHSQEEWNYASSDQRYSAIHGVVALLDDPTITPEQLHEHWRKVKLQQRWVYGETKDADAKTHPCLVPYAELPAEQRAKDDLFRGVVLGALSALGHLKSPHSSSASEETAKLHGWYIDARQRLTAERQRARLPEELVKRIKLRSTALGKHYVDEATLLRDILAWYEGE